jgi:hypothetical protein
MPYTAQISRTNPACVLLMVDQSKSMAEPYGATAAQSKAAVVADSVNRLIQNLVLRSAKSGGVRDYFHVGLVGYGREVKSCLAGNVFNAVLQPISKLSDSPLRVETRTRITPDGSGGMTERKIKFPIWYEPQAGGPTPMCEAFDHACHAVRKFAEAHPASFPPIVINMTDGKPTDGDPGGKAWLVRMVSTDDGNALLFNILMSVGPMAPTYFPANEDQLTDEYAQALYKMSSQLPPKLLEAARAEGFGVRDGARGAVINADPTALVRFLDIGTRVSPPGGAG